MFVGLGDPGMDRGALGCGGINPGDSLPDSVMAAHDPLEVRV